jgi:2-polyprenyl-6-methoxyphenol hydroxylase-like FAD-dependent oxidoreductase
MKFIVIGGGICGLTTAIALIRSGHEVGIFEAASELREAGAGVVLGANAMRALHALRIHDVVKAAGSEISTMSVCEANGAPISEMDTLKFTQTSGFRNIAIHRADLQRILLEHLPKGTVQLSSPFERFEQNSEQVTAYFAGDIAATADGLLAADGIHSRARLQVFPKSLPRFAGYTCWRGIAEASALRLPAGRSFEFWGGADRFGYVPLAANQVYWYACTNSPIPNNPSFHKWRITDLQRQFAEFTSPVPELLSRTPDDRLLWNDIVDVKPVECFAHGRVLLLGDAAHATTPNLGQGAGQAVEDAAMLSQCLHATRVLPQSFLEFDRQRRPRTTRIVNLSWQLGKIAHLESFWLANLRNLAMRRMPRRISERQMAFLYQR